MTHPTTGPAARTAVADVRPARLGLRQGADRCRRRGRGRGVLLRAFVGQMFLIPSSSMEQTLRVDDRVVVEKISRLQRGEVVVFADPGGWLSGPGRPRARPRRPCAAVRRRAARHRAPSTWSSGSSGLPGDRVVCCDDRGPDHRQRPAARREELPGHAARGGAGRSRRRSPSTSRSRGPHLRARRQPRAQPRLPLPPERRPPRRARGCRRLRPRGPGGGPGDRRDLAGGSRALVADPGYGGRCSRRGRGTRARRDRRRTRGELLTTDQNARSETAAGGAPRPRRTAGQQAGSFAKELVFVVVGALVVVLAAPRLRRPDVHHPFAVDGEHAAGRRPRRGAEDHGLPPRRRRGLRGPGRLARRRPRRRARPVRQAPRVRRHPDRQHPRPPHQAGDRDAGRPRDLLRRAGPADRQRLRRWTRPATSTSTPTAPR